MSSVASAPAALRLGAAPLGRNSRSANNRGGANTFVVRPRRAAPVALKSRVDVRGSRRMTRAVAEGADIGGDVEGDADLSIVVDGDSDAQFTIVSIKATNRPGILQLMKTTLEDLGLSVEKTEVDMEGDLTADTFYVTGDNGAKVDDIYDLANIKQVIKVVINAHYLKSNQGARPKDTTSFLETNPRQKDLLYSLMDSYAKNDVLSVQKSIVDHVEYTLARSRYRFDDFEAYQVRAARSPATFVPFLWSAKQLLLFFPIRSPRRETKDSPTISTHPFPDFPRRRRRCPSATGSSRAGTTPSSTSGSRTLSASTTSPWSFSWAGP